MIRRIRAIGLILYNPGMAQMIGAAIREKYGGKLPKAINRAIRAEVAGGNQALDRLTDLAGAARHSGWKDRAGRNTPEAVAYFDHKRKVVDRMDAEVRKRWGVPPDEGSMAAESPVKSPRKSPRKPPRMTQRRKK